METNRFDRMTRHLGSGLDLSARRRTLLQGAAAIGAAVFAAGWFPESAEAKILCRKTGAHCTKKSKKCKAGNCLRLPFTIEATWTNVASDHDSYLFVPNKTGSSVPSPFIDFECTPATSDCQDDVYPFACVNTDAFGPGDEITTVRRLIPGTYEYWNDLHESAPAGDLTLTLRNESGRVVRSWSSPENTSSSTEQGWHVFDINGANRSIASVDELSDAGVLFGAHVSQTNVCPV